MVGFLLRRLVYLAVLAAVATSLAYPLAAARLDPGTPVLARFGRWAAGVARGDLGRSLLGKPLGTEIGPRIWVSLGLVLAGALIGTALHRRGVLHNRDLLLTARAGGFTRRRALLGVGVRPVLIPLSTFLADHVGAIFAGSVLVERAFDWPGLGGYLVAAITARDVDATAAGVLAVAVLVTAVRLLAEVVRVALEPGGSR